jgi:hypothetical protein
VSRSPLNPTHGDTYRHLTSRGVCGSLCVGHAAPKLHGENVWHQSVHTSTSRLTIESGDARNRNVHGGSSIKVLKVCSSISPRHVGAAEVSS